VSDVLEAARKKLLRALEHARASDKLAAEYRDSRPFEIVRLSDGTEEFRITSRPRIDISVLAGEILYQCRSALDHLFFELVHREYGASLPKNLVIASQFPLLNKPPSGYSVPVPKDKLLAKEGLFNWVPDDAYTFIESVQPYHGRDAGHRALRILAKLSNIDKHRHLTAVAVIPKSHETLVNRERNVSTVLGLELHDGAQIKRLWHPPEIAYGEVEVERKIVLQIAFKEPELGFSQRVPLEQVTHHLPLHVLQIVNVFQRFL